MEKNKHDRTLDSSIAICETRMMDLCDQMYLPLKVEIGTLRITLRDLSAITPGQIFSLGHSIESPLKVMLYDHVVGLAKLVQIDSEFGLEIIERFEVFR